MPSGAFLRKRRMEKVPNRAGTRNVTVAQTPNFAGLHRSFLPWGDALAYPYLSNRTYPDTPWKNALKIKFHPLCSANNLRT